MKSLTVAASAVLLAKLSHAQLSTGQRQRRLRALSAAKDSTLSDEQAADALMDDSFASTLVDSMSMGSYGNMLAAGGRIKSGKSSKSSKSRKAPVFTGRYSGIDTEDGTPQRLQIICTEGICDIVLGDFSFSTCLNVTGIFFGGGIALASGVPEGSLGEFSMDLYCAGENGVDINFSNGPSTTLKGDLVFLDGGAIRRTGTNFLYPKASMAKLSEVSNLNGYYTGMDTEDGSRQVFTISCLDNICDIVLQDNSFSTCRDIDGTIAPGRGYTGFGVARQIPQGSLDNFLIQLYCLKPLLGELEIDIDDPNRLPDANLTGDISIVQDGIISRTGPGFKYFLESDLQEVEPFVDGKSFASQMTGVDIEDGSDQSLTVRCDKGICDVTLVDSSFSSCYKPGGGTPQLLNGVALARDIPEELLGNFSLGLYCAPINLGAQPFTLLKGDMEFLSSGIVKRTSTNFTYYKKFKGDSYDDDKLSSINNGEYFGNVVQTGNFYRKILWCTNGLCEINFRQATFPPCFGTPGTPSFKPVYNGFGIARNVPKEHLDDFSIDVYCVPGDVLEVDIENDDPSYSIKGGVIPASPPGVIHQTDLGIDLYQRSTD